MKKVNNHVSVLKVDGEVVGRYPYFLEAESALWRAVNDKVVHGHTILRRDKSLLSETVHFSDGKVVSLINTIDDTELTK